MEDKSQFVGIHLAEPLTARERDVLRLLAQSLRYQDIAERLTLAVSSVKWYIQQIYGKLGVDNRRDAIIHSQELGLLKTESSSSTPSDKQPHHNLPIQLTSFVAPILICIIIPYLILNTKAHLSGFFVFAFSSILLALLGLVICLGGLAGFVLTVRMFILIGNGTIMPWDPTRKLVTASLYGYVRNPMILSVITMVVGEAIMFVSVWLALLAVLFWVINTVYFVYSEEPRLEKRFGQEYMAYKKNVPRWIPRRSPWQPG